MKTFHSVADCTFEAEDIDDAFGKLSDHFLTLATGVEPGDSDSVDFNTLEELQFIGKMEIK